MLLFPSFKIHLSSYVEPEPEVTVAEWMQLVSGKKMYDDIQKKRPISNPLNKVSTGADNDLCIPGGDKKKKKITHYQFKQQIVSHVHMSGTNPCSLT